MKRRPRRHASAYAVLAASLFATLVATVFALKGARAADERRFEDAADRAVSAIDVRLDAYISALYAGSAMFRGSQIVTPAEFREFSEALQIGRRYPGIQGIGFAKLLRPEEVPAFEAEMREHGATGFHVWPLDPPRERYSCIAFLEPLDPRNARAIGYDMLSEAVRREAMERAAVTGAPAASGKVTLVQETDANSHPGFLIYLPVYDDHGLRGWIYAPFRAPDLLGGMFPDTPKFAFSVYIASEPDPEALIFQTDPVYGDGLEHLRTRRQLMVAGQQWTFAFRAHQGLLPDSSHSAQWVALLGTVVSLLLFALARLRARARALAEERQERTRILADAGRVLGESLDYEATLDRVAKLAVANLADWCIVHLKDDERTVRDVALAHRDPQMTQFGWEVVKRFPRDPDEATGVANVIRTGTPELTAAIPGQVIDQTAQSEEHRQILRDLQIRSFMCVPLIARGQTVGAITFVSSEAGRFQQEDLAFAQELAQLAAAAVDNARLYLRAQQAIRIRDEFLSVASHELKTPLTSMMLKLETLRRVRAVTDDVRETRAREVLERQVRRLTRLVDSLLDVSRIASGRLRLEVSEVDLVSLAQEVIHGLSDELAAATTALHLEFPPAIVGHWDRLRTEQVLTNLLTNAIKYGQGNAIRLQLIDSPQSARIVVQDRGIGISESDLDRIFERFERAVPVANYGGLGLGLYIARQIVEALGGRIQVESRPGEGSTFTVDLPKASPTAQVTIPADPRVAH